jgi:hypothetical protein
LSIVCGFREYAVYFPRSFDFRGDFESVLSGIIPQRRTLDLRLEFFLAEGFDCISLRAWKNHNRHNESSHPVPHPHFAGTSPLTPFPPFTPNPSPVPPSYLSFLSITQLTPSQALLSILLIIISSFLMIGHSNNAVPAAEVLAMLTGATGFVAAMCGFVALVQPCRDKVVAAYDGIAAFCGIVGGIVSSLLFRACFSLFYL